MVETVLDRVRGTGLFASGGEIVAMCSGGRDSICLLDVATTLLDRGAVHVLHVNYGLRGRASEADEELVRTLCRRLGVSLEVVSPRRPADGAGNLQAWARDVRYAAAARHGGLVATGHTATDQAETVLYRLAASPGRRALLGMPMRDGRLIRPLLGVTREQTAAYCAARGLGWGEDETNDDMSYARARTRGRVMPELRGLHPAAEQNILRTAELLRDEAAVLDEVLRTVLAGRAEIGLARLAALPTALARLVVVRLAEDAAGRLVPGAGDRVEQLLSLAPAGGSGQLDVGGSVRAVVEYGVLRMEPIGPELEPLPAALPVPGWTEFGDWEVRCEVGAPDEGLERLRSDGSVGLLDAAAVGSAPLTVRAWRAGDRLCPLGMEGSRTLADIFTDRHVPRADRRRLPVVVCEDAIAWVPGVVTAEDFRVDDSTTRAAILTAERTGP